MRPEEVRQRKIPMTPSRIKPATFRLVEQCPKQLRHRLPNNNMYKNNSNIFFIFDHF
jgi:hypothetical protein